MADDHRAILEVLTEIRDSVAGFDRLEAEFRTATSKMEAEAKKVGFDRTSESAKALEADVARTAKALVRHSRQSAKATKELEQATRLVNKQVQDLGKRGAVSINDLRKAVALLATSFVAVKIREQIGIAVELGLAYDQAKTKIEAFASSQDDANQKLDFAKQVARDLNLNIVDTTALYADLTSKTRDTSLAGEATEKIFRGVATAIIATGGGTQELNRALIATAQVVTKDRASLEELTQQLGELLPVIPILAKETGRSTREITKLVEEGKLVAEDVLVPIAEGFENAFGSEVQAQLDSTLGTFRELQAGATEVRASFGSAFAEEIAETIRAQGLDLKENADLAAFLGHQIGRIPEAFIVLQKISSGALDVVKAKLTEALLEPFRRLLLVQEEVLSSIPGIGDTLATNTRLTLESIAVAIENAQEKGAEGAKKLQEGLDRAEVAGAELLTEITELSGEAEKAGEAAGAAFDRAAEGEERLSLGAAGILRGVTTLEQLRQKAADLAEAYEHLSQKQGVTIGETNQLAEEAKELVQEFENMGAEAPEDIQKIADAFVLVGEDLEKLEKQVEDFRESITDTLDDIKKGFEDAARAQELLEKSKAEKQAVENVEALEDEKESLEELQTSQGLSLEQSERLFEIEGELAGARAEAKRQLDGQILSTEELARKQAEQNRILDAAKDLFNQAENAAEGLREKYGDVGDTAAQRVDDLIQGLELQRDAFGLTEQDLENFGNQLDNVLQGAVDQAKAAAEAAEQNKGLAEGARDAGKAAGDLADKTGKAADALKEAGDEGESTAEKFESLEERLKGLEEAVGKTLLENVKAVTAEFKQWPELLKEAKKCAEQLPDLI